VKKVLDPALVPNKAKTFVNKEPRDSARWHTEASSPTPQVHPKGTQPGTGERATDIPRRQRETG
jgi:hypothetical protein